MKMHGQALSGVQTSSDKSRTGGRWEATARVASCLRMFRGPNRLASRKIRRFLRYCLHLKNETLEGSRVNEIKGELL